MDRRPLIGIITARASGEEQHQILMGILTKAEKLGMETVIFSNIYNFNEYHADVQVENKIYELICSERLDGLILTAESVLNPELQQYIYKMFRDLDIPVIVTGAEIEGYECINNDVKQDFRDIAHHLTDVHGFTDIDILTGFLGNETSDLRADGVLEVLNEKGIPTERSKVIYGDFWLHSGENLAQQYISGRRKMPQAVVCANDYMAYGLLDTFFKADIDLPQQITVVGYEHIGGRIYHSPVLTTYQRNRFAVGEAAAARLFTRITGTPTEEISLAGHMICGNTCSCGISKKYLGDELDIIRTRNYYSELNLTGNFQQQAAMCRSISDYIHVLQEFSYMIRNISGVYLCLYENWCAVSEKSSLDDDSLNMPMICYRVISPFPGSDLPQHFLKRNMHPDILPGAGRNKYLYFLPLFSEGRDLGYFIFLFNQPETFDTVLCEWLKIAANALEVLRLKNDINALLECRNLSEFHDPLTGILNKNGFMSETGNALKSVSPSEKLMVIMVRTGIYSDNVSIDGQSSSVKAELEAAACLSRCSFGRVQFSGKITDRLFAVAALGNFPENYDQIASDKITILINHSDTYRNEYGYDSITCCGACVDAENADLDQICTSLAEQVVNRANEMNNQRRDIAIHEMLNIRQRIVDTPGDEHSPETMSRLLNLSCGHFRAMYKESFGISFHQDIIKIRMDLAKYLLITTSMNIPAISMRCGYDDDKYFIRKFRQHTGLTPNQYRNPDVAV